MTCIAIIEAAKRASESVHKEKLIAFFKDKSKDVLHQLDIPTTSEMHNWNGEEWIQNLNQENPLITDEIIDEFEIWFTQGLYLDLWCEQHGIYLN